MYVLLLMYPHTVYRIDRATSSDSIIVLCSRSSYYHFCELRLFYSSTMQSIPDIPSRTIDYYILLHSTWRVMLLSVDMIVLIYCILSIL